jgi:hypothetical protein
MNEVQLINRGGPALFLAALVLWCLMPKESPA